MNDKSIHVLASKEYCFLFWLGQQPCVTLSNKKVVRMSQLQLADAYGVSSTTIFHWIERLKEIKCIEQHNKKSGYIVTPIGYNVIALMEELRKITGGKCNEQCK